MGLTIQTINVWHSHTHDSCPLRSFKSMQTLRKSIWYPQQKFGIFWNSKRSLLRALEPSERTFPIRRRYILAWESHKLEHGLRALQNIYQKRWSLRANGIRIPLNQVPLRSWCFPLLNWTRRSKIHRLEYANAFWITKVSPTQWKIQSVVLKRNSSHCYQQDQCQNKEEDRFKHSFHR